MVYEKNKWLVIVGNRWSAELRPPISYFKSAYRQCVAMLAKRGYTPNPNTAEIFSHQSPMYWDTSWNMHGIRMQSNEDIKREQP